jgi:hypothetical protein
MSDSVTVRDVQGDIRITLADMRKYHGQDFDNGLSMALKACQIAFAKLTGGTPPERRKIRLVLALSPPGILDGFEYITRALSDRRAVIDPACGRGPESYNGRYYFEVHYEGRKVALWLRDGIVPDGYTLLAKRGFLGLLAEDEMAAWRAGKQRIAETVMRLPAEQVFETSEVLPA